MTNEIQKLFKDIMESLRLWRFWTHLGWNDIAKQYRRSFLGPVWMTLNTGIFTIGFSIIGSQLFKQPLEFYLAYFAPGTVIFSYYSSLMSEGCTTYTSSENYLKQSALPKMMFVFRVVVRNLIMLGHHAFIVFGALWWVGYVGSIRWAELLLGFALSLVAAVLVVAILGAIATRFRDVPMMVTSALPVLFFLTPVFWRVDQVTEQVRWLVGLNPFVIFLDLIRNPLLGHPLTQQLIVSALLVIALLVVGYLPLYLVARRRIVYWL